MLHWGQCTIKWCSQKVGEKKGKWIRLLSNSTYYLHDTELIWHICTYLLLRYKYYKLDWHQRWQKQNKLSIKSIMVTSLCALGNVNTHKWCPIFNVQVSIFWVHFGFPTYPRIGHNWCSLSGCQFDDCMFSWCPVVLFKPIIVQ